MTVQELYDLTLKKADPRKVEIRLRPDDDGVAEVEFEEEDGEVSANLIFEGAIHLRDSLTFAIRINSQQHSQRR
jgi:hypothetical protein